MLDRSPSIYARLLFKPLRLISESDSFSSCISGLKLLVSGSQSCHPHEMVDVDVDADVDTGLMIFVFETIAWLDKTRRSGKIEGDR